MGGERAAWTVRLLSSCQRHRDGRSWPGGPRYAGQRRRWHSDAIAGTHRDGPSGSVHAYPRDHRQRDLPADRHPACGDAIANHPGRLHALLARLRSPSPGRALNDRAGRRIAARPVAFSRAPPASPAPGGRAPGGWPLLARGRGSHASAAGARLMRGRAPADGATRRWTGRPGRPERPGLPEAAEGNSRPKAMTCARPPVAARRIRPIRPRA